MGYNNIKYENAHKPWHPRGILGPLIQSQCVATLIISLVRLVSSLVLSCLPSLHELMSCMRDFAVAMSDVFLHCCPKSVISPGDYTDFSFEGIPAS